MIERTAPSVVTVLPGEVEGLLSRLSEMVESGRASRREIRLLAALVRSYSDNEGYIPGISVPPEPTRTRSSRNPFHNRPLLWMQDDATPHEDTVDRALAKYLPAFAGRMTEARVLETAIARADYGDVTEYFLPSGHVVALSYPGNSAIYGPEEKPA